MHTDKRALSPSGRLQLRAALPGRRRRTGPLGRGRERPPRPRAWYGFGARCVCAHPPPPSRGRSRPSIPGGKATADRRPRGGSTHRPSLRSLDFSPATLTCRWRCEPTSALEQIRAPVSCLDLAAHACGPPPLPLVGEVARLLGQPGRGMPTDGSSRLIGAAYGSSIATGFVSGPPAYFGRTIMIFEGEHSTRSPTTRSRNWWKLTSQNASTSSSRPRSTTGMSRSGWNCCGMSSQWRTEAADILFLAFGMTVADGLSASSNQNSWPGRTQ